ncbi:M20 family metallopeptidase [Siccirubricoccus sp. KC 17139]|uniref:M20 family metallopeptidase n=1 Tax=Siccirubricoccus soli TaxID=2899147 RepID=A0ABT1CZA8_9PROT|nr:M20 aminoacylase family protein [Siccirubricoccus soli]MCO6414991.1 M20 family metallopeptidase [Siccirubricoccus soli]MCP2681122.1 M20 family metallopeptidase [Siccirubricoccus soli]
MLPDRPTPIDHIRRHQAELTAWRRDFHAHPETGFQEVRTSALVAERLEAMGIEVHRGIGRTGVVGVLRNGRGNRAIGLRADMDALDMPEANEFAHRSTIPGKMHGCGHDGHTTMLLGAAKYLAETRNFDGIVHFIFQPAEEGTGGAQAMVAEGLFERFPCDAVYGLHNRPGMPVGHYGICTGPMMAGCGFFDLEIRGKGGHGARPETTVDPVVCGAAIVSAFQSIVARNVAPNDTAVVSVTGFSAGTAYNVIPEKVALRGTVRAFRTETMRLVEARMRALATAIASGHGATAELTFREIAVPVVNGAEQTALIADAAAAMVGEAQLDRNRTPAMGSEDFSYMLAERPGAYILVGNGEGEAGGCEVHNPRYDFNDEAIPYGAGILAAVVEKELPKG